MKHKTKKARFEITKTTLILERPCLMKYENRRPDARESRILKRLPI